MGCKIKMGLMQAVSMLYQSWRQAVSIQDLRNHDKFQCPMELANQSEQKKSSFIFKTILITLQEKEVYGFQILNKRLAN